MSYGDYVEQLTYLLFLKMADERTKPPYNQPSAVPAKYNWPTLLKRERAIRLTEEKSLTYAHAVDLYLRTRHVQRQRRASWKMH